jgi:hypothetical protein
MASAQGASSDVKGHVLQPTRVRIESVMIFVAGNFPMLSLASA